MEPAPPALGAWRLSHWTTREGLLEACLIVKLGILLKDLASSQVETQGGLSVNQERFFFFHLRGSASFLTQNFHRLSDVLCNLLFEC